MPKSVSFVNMKGGVGKTTLAVSVAYGLAHLHDKRVLLVDIDPQFNASTYLMSDDDYLAHRDRRHTVLDIFRKKREPVQTVQPKNKKRPGASDTATLETCKHTVVRSTTGRLDLIPSTLALMELQMSDRGTENRLANFLKKYCQNYDYIIIDCPPTISFFTQAAILASDSYLVPMRPDPLAAIGLPLLERWLEDFTENAGIQVNTIGIVFTYVRGPLPNRMRDVMDELRQARGSEVFDSFVRASFRMTPGVVCGRSECSRV